MNRRASPTLTCIVCPNGCMLTAGKSRKGYRIRGNQCARGKAYGIREMSDPRRTVTAVVASANSGLPCVPVKTDAPLPKPLIRPLLRRLYRMKIGERFRCGQVVLKDFRGCGVNVVCTRSSNPFFDEMG